MPVDQDAARLRDHCAVDRGSGSLHLPNWILDDWVAFLAVARNVDLGSTQVLMREGQAQNSLLIVVGGELEVRAGIQGDAFGPLRRERFGAVIGEIAFFDGGARSATVWATEPTRLVELHRAAVMAFAAQRPARGIELFCALGQVLAWRVRRNEADRGAGAR